MKYANFIHAAGAFVIVIYALMMIFPTEQASINMNALLALGFLLGYIGQSMKLKYLKKQIESNKLTTDA